MFIKFSDNLRKLMLLLENAEFFISITPGTGYLTTVGAGAAGINAPNNGLNGSNSVFASIISQGGGGGA
jgi:hypothetical protein